MASSENVFYTVFPIEGTVNNRGIILHVRERYFDSSVVLTQGTTLSNFMSDKDIEKGTAISQGFGNYTYSKQLDKEENMLRFVFLPPGLTPTLFNSYPNLEPSMYWPKVLTEMRAYRRAQDDTYTIRCKYKDAYQGPTRTLVEEFYSPVPFDIPAYTPMLERGLVDEVGFAYYIGMSGPYWMSVGSLNLDSCLHPAINIIVPVEPPIQIGVIIYSQATLYDTATNYTDWPATLVIDDRQQETLGGWIRKKVTAYRPTV